MQVEADQDPLGVREVADDAADRLGQLLDDRRRRQDLLVLGQLGPLQDVDDDQVVLPFELLLADAPQVGDRLLARGVWPVT
jgi:hypothetical protein